MINRTAIIERQTKETKIKLALSMADGAKHGLFGGTGIGFFDHMINSFAIHGRLHMQLEVTGDLDVDCHHTVEDTGIVLGRAFREIVEKNMNITRFASEHIPMDESLAFCSVDIGGRGYLVFNAEFNADSIGGYDTQMTKEFFYALAQNMFATLHINLLYGENDHHKTEAIFKVAAKCIGRALVLAGHDVIVSAKGTII